MWTYVPVLCSAVAQHLDGAIISSSFLSIFLLGGRFEGSMDVLLASQPPFFFLFCVDCRRGLSARRMTLCDFYHRRYLRCGFGTATITATPSCLMRGTAREEAAADACAFLL